MSKDIEKLVSITDDDIDITYRRRAKNRSTDEIHGFNPIIILMIFVFGLIAFVAISQNPKSSNSNPSNVIIVK